MGTWILIITFIGSGAYGDHIEFLNQTACENAAKQIKNQRYSPDIAICVPKGD